MSLSLGAGEVLALMGENGAGKSTLMKILGGAYPPDEGEILVDGEPVTLGGVRDARRTGIALIHQELMLAPNLDITANIFLGNEGPRTPWLAARVAARRARTARRRAPGASRPPRAAGHGGVLPDARARCRWSRSPRPSPWTRASSSWTSRPRR